MRIDRSQITGVVLAGGRGSRMGGVDKGLQLFHGVPLALHALRRLAPQVGAVMINANRNLDAYEAMGVAVRPDALPDFAGPLAGWLAGLRHGGTPWLATVACDTPNFPTDLVERLGDRAAAAGADIAMAATREGDTQRTQPVFCLLKATLADDLEAFLRDGQRKVDRFTARHRTVVVEFDDANAFYNVNTIDELHRLG